MSTTRTRRPAHLSRGALVIPGALAALGVFLLYGTLTMDVVGDGGLFGPTMMPWAVGILSLVIAALLTFDILRPRPEFDAPVTAGPPATDEPPQAPETVGPETVGPDTGTAPEGVNATAVLVAVLGVVGFIVALPWLGWILSATGLFVAVAAALGNRRWLTVALAGLAVSSAIQIAFSMLLGIALPAGFVGGF